MDIKRLVRNTLNLLRLDLTQNLQYDRLTKRIMRQVLTPSANCVDVGCHKGEILESILRLAPDGRHFAFEPIPVLHAALAQRYAGRATVHPFALSDRSGRSTFQYVRNAPAYSGIQRREYAIAHPDIEEIAVEVRTLDEVLPEGVQVDFIKIDVEGGEFGVLRGARDTLLRCRPVVIFECGLGASDRYGTRPEALYGYLTQELGMRVSTLSAFAHGRSPLTAEGFVGCFSTGSEFYFVAH